MRILLVDDHGVNRYNVSKALQRVGYVVVEADSGEAALERFFTDDFDLILAEIALAQMSGIDLLRAVKQRAADAIVILISEDATVDEAIQALRYGARDLLLRPISSEEICQSVERGIESARSSRRRRRLLDTMERAVAELAREASPADNKAGAGVFVPEAPQRSETPDRRGNSISLGSLAILPGNYQITTGDKAISLTPTEFDLLLYLAAHRDRVANCQELVKEVRGYVTDETEAREVIRPHVSNLRRKLRGLGEIDLIVNVRGVGYRLGEVPEDE